VELGTRKSRILESLIDSYIATGEPVSSKAICDMLDFPISSATIRSEMAELTSLGLLEQPHTSAGRIPSHLGYRVYINQIMKQKSDLNLEQRLGNLLYSVSVYKPEDLLNNILETLAEITQCTIISATDKNSIKIKNIQLIPAGKRLVLIILLTSFNKVKNKLIKCDYEFPSEVLLRFQEVLQEKFCNLEISKVNKELIKEINISLGQMSILLAPFVMAISELAKEASDSNLTLIGQNNLLFRPELDKLTLQAMTRFLNSPGKLIDFLFNIKEQGLSVLIGKEIGLQELYDLSIIISSYKFSDDNSGIIALIGPTRMDYSEMIPSVEKLAFLISKILGQILE